MLLKEKAYQDIYQGCSSRFEYILKCNLMQPCHPAAQDWLPTEAKQGWAGQYLDGRPSGKTRLLLEEVLVRPAGGAHPK